MTDLALVSIMQDEAAYVPQWLAGLQWAIDERLFAHILVVDGGSRDATADLLRSAPLPSWSPVEVLTLPFARNFAAQRNFACERSKGDWIFELDADEIPCRSLLHQMRDIIDNADRDAVDCIGLPRLNFLDGKLVTGPGARGLDYQYRLHRRHVHWQRPVHEEMVGWKKRVELSLTDGHFLAHMKTSVRHELRNAVYREMNQ